MHDAIAFPGLSLFARPMGPAPLSSAIRADRFLFLSGQVAIDPLTGAVVGDDIVTQTRQVLTNMRVLVEAAGFAMRDVVKVSIFLVDPADFAAMNAVYQTFFDTPFPARTTVGIALNDPRLRVEMDAIALLPERS